MLFGVASLPKFFRDTTDRNRTSPFAFTGNKFEFRMLGASNSIACTNIMLNAAISDVLREFADRLEDCPDFDTELHTLLKETIKEHKRILFNGNGYDASWIEEAEKRGLPNRRTTPDSLPHLLDKKNVEMLKRAGVFSETELKARCEILLENYTKTVAIEAATMADMSRRQIMPAVSKYAAELSERADKNTENEYEVKTSKRLSELLKIMYESTNELEKVSADIRVISDVTEHSYAIRDRLLPVMARLREAADEAETLTAEDFWPFPTYEKLLFSVN
jgi:glutamine synthetase